MRQDEIEYSGKGFLCERQMEEAKNESHIQKAATVVQVRKKEVRLVWQEGTWLKVWPGIHTEVTADTLNTEWGQTRGQWFSK